MNKKFTFTVKDPIMTQKPNNNFILYFGKVALSLKTCERPGQCSEIGSTQPIDVGFLNKNPEIDFDTLKTGSKYYREI